MSLFTIYHNMKTMDQGDYAVLATVGIVAWALGASGLIIWLGLYDHV